MSEVDVSRRHAEIVKQALGWVKPEHPVRRKGEESLAVLLAELEQAEKDRKEETRFTESVMAERDREVENAKVAEAWVALLEAALLSARCKAAYLGGYLSSRDDGWSQRAEEIAREVMDALATAVTPQDREGSNDGFSGVPCPVAPPGDAEETPEANEPDALYVAERFPPLHMWMRSPLNPGGIEFIGEFRDTVFASIDEALAAMGFVRAVGSPGGAPTT